MRIRRYLGRRSLIAAGLLVVVSVLLAAPVLAAELRSGDVVVIDQDVDDDLYIAGGKITINSTIHGDLFALGVH